MIAAFVFAQDAEKQEVLSQIEVRMENPALSFVTEQDIQRLTEDIGLEPGVTYLHAVQLKGLEQALRRNPWIAEVNCYIGSQGKLIAHIRQKEPVVRIQMNDSSSYGYYLDAKASPVPLSDQYIAQVPIVTSQKMGYTHKDIQLKKQLVELALFMQQDSFWNVMITQIQVNQHKELELMPALGHHIIRLGNTNQLSSRMQQLKTFYQEGMAVIDWNRYNELDIRYAKQVIARHTEKKELVDKVAEKAAQAEREKQKLKYANTTHGKQPKRNESLLVKTSVHQ